MKYLHGGMDATLKNGLTAKVEYKTSRILNLSMSACQLVETASRDFVIGLGYDCTSSTKPISPI